MNDNKSVFHFIFDNSSNKRILFCVLCTGKTHIWTDVFFVKPVLCGYCKYLNNFISWTLYMFSWLKFPLIYDTILLSFQSVCCNIFIDKFFINDLTLSYSCNFAHCITFGYFSSVSFAFYVSKCVKIHMFVINFAGEDYIWGSGKVGVKCTGNMHFLDYFLVFTLFQSLTVHSVVCVQMFMSNLFSVVVFLCLGFWKM